MLLILFDLDQTLIDTKLLEPLRQARNWKLVFQSLDKTSLYPGIADLLLYIKSKGHLIGIVTSSPSSYANNLLRHHNLDIPLLCAYHDTRRHKPDPEPILHAVKKTGVNVDEVWHVGDAVGDVVAGKAADVRTIAAGWDCTDPEGLANCGADLYCRTVAELRKALP